MTRNMTKIWLLGSGSGSRGQKCDKNMKIIWIKCENNVNLANHIIFIFFSYYFHIIFTFYSYYSHIFITFLGSGPRSGPQQSYFCHIPGHILFIFFLYPPSSWSLCVWDFLKSSVLPRSPLYPQSFQSPPPIYQPPPPILLKCFL